jgi:hypothetical protein
VQAKNSRILLIRVQAAQLSRQVLLGVCYDGIPDLGAWGVCLNVLDPPLVRLNVIVADGGHLHTALGKL